MPNANFWIDWTVPGSLQWLRDRAPVDAHSFGFALEEKVGVTTSSGWGAFNVRRLDDRLGPVGIVRAQDVDGQLQIIIGPLRERTDEAALCDLNDFSVWLYTELIRLGKLAPPAPLEPVARPLAVSRAPGAISPRSPGG